MFKCAETLFKPSALREYERGVGNFSIQYKNAVHGTARASPAQLYKSGN